MDSPISERVQLAQFCSSRDWSKAIRVLDFLLANSTNVQDICNRAFCYSQLELHKHAIKDCDRALKLDSKLLQAYILKGRSLSSLGRNEDALMAWEQGYKHALSQSADLKQFLELEELLKLGKQERSNDSENHGTDVSRSNKTSENDKKSTDICYLCNEPRNALEITRDSDNTFELCDGTYDKGEERISQPILGPRSDMIGQEDTNGNHAQKNDESKSCCESAQAFESCKPRKDHDIQNELCHKAGGSKKFDIQMNGNDIPNKLRLESESHHDVSSLTKLMSKSPMIYNNSGDASESHNKLAKADVTIELDDEARRNKKFSVNKISKTKSISIDFRLSRGIAQVNEGKYASAISIFDQILTEDPTYPEALIGRGTAYAFQRELEAAIADFSKAIQSNALAGEAWKRRGQARAALGEPIEAIEDLTKALEFEPDSVDILHERGIVNFKFKDFNSAVEDLSACVNLDRGNKSAHTYLGLALSSLGEYKRAEEAHLESIELDGNFTEAWAHLTQFYQDLANSTKAFECIQHILQIDSRFAKAYHLHGLLLHGMGQHMKAIKDLSIGLSIEKSNIDCLYLRASCLHAIGEYREAVKDYDAILDLELDSVEKFVLQCMAFYQKELALYTASKVKSKFCWFDIDGDINPLFKEYWCKRLHPKNVCERVYRQPPLHDSLKRGKLKKQDFVMTKQKTSLLHAADSIGKKIQYNCPGFLPNRRQHRMAGLAAIEIAQKISKLWRSLQAEWKHSTKGTLKHGKRVRRRNMLSQNRGGAGCSTSSSLETSYGIMEDRSSFSSAMSWQDVYSIAVKWRQISEPCDPVVWVNRLSEEFNSGFGSHTPMVLGQAKVVRYHPNYERTLNVAKMVIKEKLYVYNKTAEMIDISKDEKLQQIVEAKTCSDLYNAVGEDFWLATWCNSSSCEGKRLEGTRITLVKMEKSGFDFAIKTPCTPSRWDDFDLEMAAAWEAVCNAYCGETYGSTSMDVLENVRDSILRMTYYWYNFMPLSRGSAVVGFIVLLGLHLAANMEYTGEIPKGMQVDWEAILNFDPSAFLDSVKGWLYPSLKITTSWKDYPDVASTFSTTGSVVAALSSYDD